MPQVSRPLIGLLVATVVFFVVWTVALKGGSGASATNKGLGAYQGAVNRAQASAANQNAAAAAANGSTAAGPGTASGTASAPATGSTPSTASTAATATTPAATSTIVTTTKSAGTAHPAATAHPATSHPAATATHAAKTHPAATATSTRPATAAQRQNAVQRALTAHKVVAMLVYNPAGADDRAVKRELAAVPTHGGQVVKFAIPLSEVTRYGVVTNQVQVQSSPTLVIIDRHGQAFTITGFADGLEISQRIDDALTMR
jgi:hypothetical protein